MIIIMMVYYLDIPKGIVVDWFYKLCFIIRGFWFIYKRNSVEFLVDFPKLEILNA